MTEEEWCTGNDIIAMGRFVQGRVNPSRVRWLAVAWGKRIRHIFEADDLLWFDAFVAWVEASGKLPQEYCPMPSYEPLDRPKEHVFWARRCANAIRVGDVITIAINASIASAHDFLITVPAKPDFDHTHVGRSKAKRHEAKQAQDDGFEASWAARKERMYAVNREFHQEFCDVVGNPFRSVAFDPAWRSSTLLAIATGIYDDRAFDRLPILADAIQDAGCENEDILNHLRSVGPHVKGCWALDLVLGKE